MCTKPEETTQQTTSSKRKLKILLGWCIGIAAIGFCVAAVVRYWGDFREHSTEIHAGLLVAGIVATLAAYVMHSLGWHVLINELSPGVKLRSSMRAWAYSQTAKYIPGKVLVFVTRAQICGRDGALPSKVLAGSTLEIIFSLVCAISITILASLTTGAIWGLPQWVYILALAGLLISIHPAVIMFVLRTYYRMRKLPASETPSLDLASILKPLAIYFVGWVFYGVGGYLLLRSLGVAAIESMQDIAGVMGAFTLSWAAGYLFLPAPGGAGVREAALVGALVPWVPALGPRAVVAVLARLCQSGLDLAFGGAWWIGHRLASRSEKGEESHGNG